MNNPFDYIPDADCDEAFRTLTDRLVSMKQSGRTEDIEFCRELEEGKMLGVLIAIDKDGSEHTLYAFSGQMGDHGFHFPGFVGPVFDYLKPDDYFKIKEGDISCQNREIDRFEKVVLARAKSEYDKAKMKCEQKISDFKEKCRISKSDRDTKRNSGPLDERDLAVMIRQSQFEKAELHRLKKKMAAELEPFSANLLAAQSHLDKLKQKRRSDSEALQKWLFSNFRLLNARGESRSLSEIFAETPIKVPPSGAGECCAPKLLQAAFLLRMKPKAIAEYWYGKPREGEVRRHGKSYPACRGKCLPVLGWMLKGLTINPPLDSEISCYRHDDPEIIYENRWFCVVNKPSGMLSVPGKGHSESVQEWLEERYGAERHVRPAHRLDQDTSGLLVATFGEKSYKIMQALFATHQIAKTYFADLEGDYEERGIPVRGSIILPLAPDWLDRPRQRVDFEGGKPAMTDYEFIGVSKGRSRIIFHPHTGRTHQLRIHAASDFGLGLPIVGDRLYGNGPVKPEERLRLHAGKLEFTFPGDGRSYSFNVPVPF